MSNVQTIEVITQTKHIVTVEISNTEEALETACQKLEAEFPSCTIADARIVKPAPEKV